MTNNQLTSLITITNILNDFLKPFDCITVSDTDFAYYPASNLITYAFIIADKHEKTFTKFVNNLFPNIKANIFLWSFLHELGHHETEDDFEDEEWEKYLNTVHLIKNDIDYYNLPIEYAATCWAGEYMMNHELEIRNLWNELAPAIQTFYNEMEVL